MAVDVHRTDAVAKVTGAARYANDVALPGMLHAKVLRSDRPHARIVGVDVARALEVPGVSRVITGEDVRAYPTFGYYIKDQPILCTDKVRYVGDPVAAVAAETEAAALEALARIRVTYEDLPILATVEDALAPDAPRIFERAQPGVVPAYGSGAEGVLEPRPNVCYEFRYEFGPPEALTSADHLFEDEFTFSRCHHYHLEPFVSVAREADGVVEVWSSTQNPFPLRKELARLFDHPEHLVRVHAGFVGGGFGAKNLCRTEPLAVLLARLTRRPVRYCLTAAEGFLTQVQHAATLVVRTAVQRDGTFVARSSDVYLQSGAYADASPLVAEKVGYRVAGPYRWQHVASRAHCVMTTTTPAGPFRGFGGTQAAWASESQVDMIARRLGMDPYDIRARNTLALGERYAPGETPLDSDLLAGLDVVVKELGYHRRRRARGRGMGLSIGCKDGGGVKKVAQAQVRVNTSGRALVHCGTVEIGQGARTALAQIVAERLRVPLAWVRMAEVDTDSTPLDHGTNASSGIAIMGTAVARAADAVREQALRFAAERLSRPASELSLEDWTVHAGDDRHPMAGLLARYYGGPGYQFDGFGQCRMDNDPAAPLGAPCSFFEVAWGGAEVEVDDRTGRVTVRKLVVSGDAGKAINLLSCRGQDEGAAVMALGQALFEQLVDADAALLTADPLTYRVPLATDLPQAFLSITQEQGHGPGPSGAKGVGEGAALVVASAIANAVEDAVGVRVTALPVTPERVLQAIRRSEGAP